MTEADAAQIARFRQAAFLAGAKAMQEAALDHVATERTRYQHGEHCCCTTCELNEVEDGIRSLSPSTILKEQGDV